MTLHVENLRCERGDRVLFSNLSFVLRPGELLYVAGKNGAGKTSLIRALATLLPADSGSIRWNDKTIYELAEEYTAQLLYLGDRPAVKDGLTAAENLYYSCLIAGNNRSKAEIWQALQQVGLQAYEDQPTRAMSFGQRRRVALAQLYLTNSTLWLLDEPFNALDVHAVAALVHTIRQHLQRGGMTIVTTHQQIDWGDISPVTLTIGSAG